MHRSSTRTKRGFQSLIRVVRREVMRYDGVRRRMVSASVRIRSSRGSGETKNVLGIGVDIEKSIGGSWYIFGH